MKPWKDEAGNFKKLTGEEMKDFSAVELADYHTEKTEAAIESLKGHYDGQIEELKNNAPDSEEIKTLKAELDAAIKDLNLHSIQIKAALEEAKGETEKPDTLKELFESKREAIAKRKGTVSMEIALKATQGYGDITLGEDFAQMRQSITDIPVRMPRFRSLFPVTPLSTEFYKYPEQETVVRDAQNVAICSPVTSNTKETIIVRTISTVVVKDMIEFCIDFVEDYPFMRSRIDRLLNESLALRIDQQVLLGTGTGNEMFSIDSYSSEFSAVNPVADVSACIQAANYIDLIAAMQTQIIELGQQNSYDPNTVILNKVDWFKFVESLKDLDNNYLDTRVARDVNGNPTVNGMQVVWSPLVPQNTLYVLDSMKGEMLDRRQVTIDMAFENRDNFESELVTMKGRARLNLLVDVNNQNAFMKCSDVATAITAITKP